MPSFGPISTDPISVVPDGTPVGPTPPPARSVTAIVPNRTITADVESRSVDVPYVARSVTPFVPSRSVKALVFI